MPCILVTFDKEQIVVWRGKDYQPLDIGYLTVRETFDDVDGNTGCVDDKVVMEMWTSITVMRAFILVIVTVNSPLVASYHVQIVLPK